MKLLHRKIRSAILKVVDFFYPPFRKFMPLQTYRYAACGGSNTAFNIFLFFIIHNFILDKRVIHIGSIAISSHIAHLKLMGKKHSALFVGQWAAPFLLLGVYNKIVKVAGHDKES